MTSFTGKYSTMLLKSIVGNKKQIIKYLIALVLYFGAISLFYVCNIVSISSINYTYPLLTPLGILIAVIAMSSGISGSNFWIPVNIGILGLDEKVGFWLALLAMLFGFSSGTIKHWKQNTIQFRLVRRYLVVSLPAAVLGSWSARNMDPKWLLFSFSGFVAIYEMKMILVEKPILPKSEIITDLIIFIGGYLKGSISTGLGKLMIPRLMNSKEVSIPAEAVGTSVCVIFITNLVPVLMVVFNQVLFETLKTNWEQIFSIMIFVIPGVIIGGQIGPILTKLMNRRQLLRYVGFLLVIVSIAMFSRGVLSN